MCVCVVFFQVKSDRLTTCITLIVLIVVNGQCAYALHCTHSLAQAQVEVEMITILMLQQLTTMMMKCGYNFVIVAVPLFRFVSLGSPTLAFSIDFVLVAVVLPLLLLLLLVLFSIHKSFTFIGISVCQQFLFRFRIECEDFSCVSLPPFISRRETVFYVIVIITYFILVALRNLLRSVIGFNFLVKFNLLLFDCCFVLFSSCLHTYLRDRSHRQWVSHNTRWMKPPTMRMWAWAYAKNSMYRWNLLI